MLPSISYRSALQVYPCVPWAFVPEAPIPPEVRTNKEARTDWINNSKTRHNIFFAWEGVNESARISGTDGTDEGNPPYRQLAFIADFDAAYDPKRIFEDCKRIQWKPAYICRSLSGNLHAVWLLEKPLLVPSKAFAVHYLNMVVEHFAPLHVNHDKGFFTAPERGLTNGCDWYPVDPEARIPESITNGWFVKAGEKFLWSQNKGHGVTIPLNDVAAELEKKYPNFRADWEGPFELGAQSRSFWIQGSTSPKSAIVRETGIQTFSAHATKGFYTWGDLIDYKWVETYETRKLGDAVKDIFHDGKGYWRKLPDGSWKPFAKEDLSDHLRARKGLKGPAKGGIGETGMAIQHVQDYAAIAGAGPFVFQPSGLIHVKGTRLLNTCTKRVLAPASGDPVWGPDGHFPWISHFFDGFFTTKVQQDNFLAWLQRFYKSAHDLSLENGQNVFIFGGTGLGKTFLSGPLIGRLLSGSIDSRRYLMGNDSFGSSLFECAVWTVDDNEMSSDAGAHRRFTEMIKRMAANNTFEYHPKFRVPIDVDWSGRVIVTANVDAESQRVLPDLERSILDKMQIYRANDNAQPGFLTNRENHARLDRELPFFARWLLTWVPPAEAVSGSPRYGITPYHDPEIVTSARHSSHSAGFKEILDGFFDEYFKMNPSAFEWVGSGLALRRAMEDAGFENVLRSYRQEDFVRRLAGLSDTRAYPISARKGSNDRRLWAVTRQDSPPAPVPITVLPPQNPNSEFSKHAS